MTSTEDQQTSRAALTKDAIHIDCPSCGYSGMSNVFDELGRLHAVIVLVFTSLFVSDAYQFRKEKVPYGFERNHYCSKCGCYVGTSGKVKSYTYWR